MVLSCRKIEAVEDGFAEVVASAAVGVVAVGAAAGVPVHSVPLASVEPSGLAEEPAEDRIVKHHS